jgi:thiamine biosynthesis lipoprotein
MSDSPLLPTRRDFLKGKAAVQAAADRLDAALYGSQLQQDPTGGTYLIHFARRAMACQFEVYLNAGQHEAGSTVAIEALDLVDQLEDQLTVYRDHSEISQLNVRAAEHPVEVEPRLFELLSQTVELHQITDGAFDITAGPLSKVWGFTRRAGAIPNEADIAEALQRVGSQYLQLDAEARTVSFSRPGVSINLGAIGKGYALDRCAELFAAAGVDDVLLHGGNSSVLARGSHGATPGQGWAVGVRNPLRPERRLGELQIISQALATSGSGSQYFIHEGQRYGHILDPRTGWPAQGVLSTTVIAPTAAMADALSTAFYVMGPKSVESFCEQHPEIAALMVCPGDRAGSIVLHGWNLRLGQWRPVDTD